MIAFTLWVSVVTLFARNPDQAWPEWQRFIKVQVMLLFMLMLLLNPERTDMTVAVIAASICFYGVKGGIFTILGGVQYMVWGPPRSFIAGNTEIGFALVITVPLLWYLRSIATQRWVRIVCVAAFGLCLISILGSYSRGAILESVSYSTGSDTGTAAPTTGSYAQGFIRWNSAPVAGGNMGWVCVSTGTPGTWKPCGVVGL